MKCDAVADTDAVAAVAVVVADANTDDSIREIVSSPT